MTLFPRRTGSRVRPSLLQSLDARALAPATAVALVFLLVVFYLVTIVNMGAIRTTVDDLKEHPYPVTVAAGQVETSLYQLRTLAERLEYVRTPEAVDAVEDEYASIDDEIKEPLQVVREQCRASADEARALDEEYGSLSAEQRELIALCRDPATTDAQVEQYVSERINPLVNDMVGLNSAIISNASGSFGALYDLADRASGSTIVLATVIMAAVLAALAIFLVVIRRKGVQQEKLQQSLEQALEKAHQASLAKSQFLASMSHDIRTPCSAIVGLTDIAERHVREPAYMEECLAKITLSSHHLISLINDVLDISKIESGQLLLNDEPFRLEELVSVVDVIAQQQARTKELAFQLDAADVAGICVRGDALHVQQVLLNLIGNSIKYTEPGGTVRLTVSRSGANPATFRFVIEDDGIGMTAAFVERIFEPFERERSDDTRSIEGTGLGMSITKSIVDQMGGSVSVQSERHRGTRFTVDLPLAIERTEVLEDLVARKQVPALPKRVDFSGVRVLLAEDDDINAEIACDIIGRTRADVMRVGDGAEAVEAVLDAPDDRYDLVFMDVQMPNMDGLEAARTLRAACARDGRRQPVIVAMTANAYVEDRREAFDAGMNDYLVKPFGFADVCDVMDAHVPARGEAQGRRPSNAAAEEGPSLV